ncbi:SHOCT domain-containing protein [Streptomyces sp. NPDC006283]|uniref:SHOCT domain-containing protein n=1 Tax=Streptomyces sp. NPDC006283 TaxID=3156741 RepID=UPI0033A3E06B
MNGYVNLAYDYPLLGAFWTMMLLFLWVLWFFLLFRIIVDVFRDDDLNGWAKAAWLLFVIVLPFLGVFVYLIARGRGMGKREQDQARTQKQALDSYIRETAAGAGGRSGVEELAKLSEMKARGDISDEEFRRAKEKILQ